MTTSERDAKEFDPYAPPGKHPRIPGRQKLPSDDPAHERATSLYVLENRVWNLPGGERWLRWRVQWTDREGCLIRVISIAGRKRKNSARSLPEPITWVGRSFPRQTSA
jgi:hypothetical protein